MQINPQAIAAAIAGAGEGAPMAQAAPRQGNIATRLNPMVDRTAAVAGYGEGAADAPQMRGPGQLPRNLSA